MNAHSHLIIAHPASNSAAQCQQQECFKAGWRIKQTFSQLKVSFVLSPCFTERFQLKNIHAVLWSNTFQTCDFRSQALRASGFSDVSFSNKEIIDFPGFVHVYLDERSCLCQPQASLLVTLVQ